MAERTPEINSWDIVLNFPSPIALAFQQYASFSDTELYRKAKAMFAVAEVSARYLTAIITADFLSTDLSTPPPERSLMGFLRQIIRRQTRLPQETPRLVPVWIDELRANVSFGKWVSALRETRDLLPDARAFMPEALRILKRQETFSLLDDLVSLRNAFIHPKGGFELSDEEIFMLMGKAKPKLIRWVGSLRFLADYPLCVGYKHQSFGSAREAAGAKTNIPYFIIRHMGREPVGYAVQVLREREIREDHPFLINPSGDRLLYLWPFFVAGPVSEEDRGKLLFVFNNQTGTYFDSVEYIGVNRRVTYNWTSQVRHDSAAWLRQHRASLPGKLALLGKGLEKLRASEKDSLIGSMLGGASRSYAIVRRLGQGGMGTVYIAMDSERRPYAIKLLQHQDMQTLKRFQREIDELGKLTQVPGIVNLLDWGDTEDPNGNLVPYYVMEYAERGDLSSFIQQMCTPLDHSSDPLAWDLEPRLAIIEDIGRSLAGLHKLGVIHRDVKPSNVLLMGDNTIRLADFGLARALAAPGLTRAWSVVGTAEYMAPEQLLGQLESVNFTSDVFGFGVLLFELLLGRLPQRRTLSEKQEGTVIAEQRVLQIVPKLLRQIILNCTQFHQSKRYRDGEALYEAIEATLPKLRRARLIVRTQPAGANLNLDGIEYGSTKEFELKSGVHIISASLGDMLARQRVIRIPPLATLEIVLKLEHKDALRLTEITPGAQPDDEFSVELLNDYLSLIKIRIATKTVGYGTTKQIEDANSQQVWKLLFEQWGCQPIPSLIDALQLSAMETRMKALQLILYYAVKDPFSVDLQRVQDKLQAEQSPIVIQAWIKFLHSSPQQNWPLLAGLLTWPGAERQAAGIPKLLRDLGDRPDIINALIEALPRVSYWPTRREVVAALSGRHPAATETLIQTMIKDPEPSVRAAAAYAVADRAPSGGFDTLINSLQADGSSQVRVACARALLSVDASRARAAFARLQSGGDSAVNAAIEEALRYLS